MNDRSTDSFLLRQILENSSVVTFLWSLPSFKLEYVNTSETAKLFGHAVELFSKTTDFWLSIIHPDDRPVALQAYNLSFLSGQAEAHFRICNKDGRLSLVKGRFRLLKGSVETAQHFLYEIETLEDNLSIELKETLLAISKSAILVYTDANGQIIEANDLFCKISGYSFNEIIGKNHRILKSGHHSDEFFRDLWKTIKAGNIWTGEIKNRAKDGSYYWVYTTIAPITDTSGKIIKYIAIRTDITAQKNAALELHKSEERWKFAIEGAGDGVWDWDILNDTMTFSQRWKEMLGYDDHEITNEVSECRRRVHPLDFPILVESMQDHLLKGGQYSNEHRMLCKDGEYKWVLHRGKVVERDSEGNPLRMIGTQSDITPNKIVEEQLRVQGERLKSIFEGSPDAIMLLSEKGFFDCNDQAIKLFGISTKEEFVKLHPAQLSPEFQPDGKLSSVKSNEQIMIAFHKSIVKFEWVHCRKNGEIFDAEVLLSSFDYGGTNMLQATVRDISDKKKVEKELNLQKEQLVVSSKMASLGVMASGIAHEINNPLTIIIGLADIMKMKVDASEKIILEDLIKDLATIKSTGVRISNIVDGLSNYSRSSINDSKDKVLVSEVLMETFQLCDQKYKNKSVCLDLVFDNDSAIYVTGRSAQISEVVLNLLINALDAVESQEEKWVKVEVTQKDESVVISVTDSGWGIPADVVTKIMDPFFTTKDPGKGTGLGLSISKKIIQDHGGKLFYDPTSSRTRFIIKLPTCSFCGTADGI